ncbi:MAG: ABC transporter substrate-binding protein [Anaerolineae bacterium]|nr:ABC transporter substrate-binding protein [Anaerolineae bacterium]
MRYKTLVLFTAIAVLLTACGKPDSEAMEVMLPMGYVANVQFSPFYMAEERGYFKEAGFDVTFDYRWETDGIRLVGTEDLPFTIASGDQVIQARSQGLPVVAVAAWYQRFPVAVVTLADQPLNTPEDLKGLSIGIPETFGASYIGLRSLLKAGGLTEEDIDLQVIGYTQAAALTAETVDAIVVYANNEPAILEHEGIAFNILYAADYDNLVSAVLVTNDTMVQEQPERVSAFVRTFLHGLQDVLDDPDTAFEICKNYVEGLEENAETQRGVFERSLDLWKAPHLGVFTTESWEEAQQAMLEAGLIEQTVPVETLFTNAFVE